MPPVPFLFQGYGIAPDPSDELRHSRLLPD